MKIACLQFAPRVGDVPNNIARAEDVLAHADPADLKNLDLLVLPEMAFSGYNFKSAEHIAPYLEPTGTGVSSQWARTMARKHGCTVAVGYPEKAETEDEEEPECYNSLVVVDSDGKQLVNYSKSFLYYTDATWAREGKGFYGGKLGSLGQAAVGICMDINPYKFEAPWDAYEFALHVQRVGANLVLLSTAWLTNDDQSTFLAPPLHHPDLNTLLYWVRRLDPVIAADSPEETIVVFANRCGTEDEATYAGTSTVLGIKGGEVWVYGLLGRGVEELLVVDTAKPPFVKIVERSASEGVSVDDEEEEEEEGEEIHEDAVDQDVDNNQDKKGTDLPEPTTKQQQQQQQQNNPPATDNLTPNPQPSTTTCYTDSPTLPSSAFAPSIRPHHHPRAKPPPPPPPPTSAPIIPPTSIPATTTSVQPLPTPPDLEDDEGSADHRQLALPLSQPVMSVVGGMPLTPEEEMDEGGERVLPPPAWSVADSMGGRGGKAGLGVVG